MTKAGMRLFQLALLLLFTNGCGNNERMQKDRPTVVKAQGSLSDDILFSNMDSSKTAHFYLCGRDNGNGSEWKYIYNNDTRIIAQEKWRDGSVVEIVRRQYEKGMHWGKSQPLMDILPFRKNPSDVSEHGFINGIGGLVLKETDFKNDGSVDKKTQVEYDFKGRPIAVKDFSCVRSNGSSTNSDGDILLTEYFYNTNELLFKEVGYYMPEKKKYYETIYYYENNFEGKVSKYISQNMINGVLLSSEYKYDKDGRLINLKELRNSELERNTNYEYDKKGRVISTVKKNIFDGNRVFVNRMRYSVAGDTEQVEKTRGNFGEGKLRNGSISYYDNNGKLVREIFTDDNGNTDIERKYRYCRLNVALRH